MNERIRVREVRLIDENGEQLGVLATPEALRIARERGLDIVEVAPLATHQKNPMPTKPSRTPTMIESRCSVQKPPSPMGLAANVRW